MFEKVQPIRIARVGGRADESMAAYALRTIRKGTLPENDFFCINEPKD